MLRRPAAWPPFPVDLVYTWVDSGDEQRGAERAQWLAKSTNLCADSATSSRVRNRDELRYSLRSVHLNLPWIRRIHIVVSGRQRPHWMTDHPRVQLVEDVELFPNRDHLPTFNSQAIECHLDRVPGLADHYLYCNDDFLFCRPIGYQSYFTRDGTPLVAYWRYGWTARIRGKRYHQGWHLAPGPTEGSFVNAWINVNRLLDGAFGERPRYVTRHHASALRRGMMAEAARLFPAAIAGTTASRFRSTTDVAPVGLAQHVALAQGRAVHSQGGLREMVVSLSGDPRVDHRRLALARVLKPHLVCVNDATPEACDPATDAVTSAYLAGQFPQPSPFEAPGQTTRAGCLDSASSVGWR